MLFDIRTGSVGAWLLVCESWRSWEIIGGQLKLKLDIVADHMVNNIPRLYYSCLWAIKSVSFDYFYNCYPDMSRMPTTVSVYDLVLMISSPAFA